MHRIEQKASKPIVSATSELADSVFDPSDKQEMRNNESAGKKRDEKAEGRLEMLHRGSRFLEVLGHAPIHLKPSTTPAPEPVARNKVTLHLGMSSEMLKALMPRGVAGAAIQIVHPKHCIIVYYPKSTPASRTRTWGCSRSRLPD